MVHARLVEKLYISVIKKTGVNQADVSEAETIDRYLRFNPMCGRKTTSDVIISGYYGFNNMGDDSILDTLKEQLTAAMPGVRIVALTKKPKQAAAKYGVRCIGRMRFLSILREMRRSRLLISGGGSLFQDSTSSKSLKYYSFIINLAVKAGLKTYVYANGVGDIYSESNRELTRRTVERADRVTMRDADSVKELVSIGVSPDKPMLTADPAFMMLPCREKDAERVCRSLGLSDGERYFAVSLRRFEGAQRRAYDEEALLRNVVKACAHTAKKYSLVPVFVVMQPNFDREISDIAAETLKTQYGIESRVIAPSSGRELYTALCGYGGMHGAEFVCSMRLHILIYACCGAIPPVGLSIDPKIDALVGAVAPSCLLRIPGATSEEMIDIFDSVTAERDEYSRVISDKVAPLRRLAEADVDAAVEMIG